MKKKIVKINNLKKENDEVENTVETPVSNEMPDPENAQKEEYKRKLLNYINNNLASYCHDSNLPSDYKFISPEDFFSEYQKLAQENIQLIFPTASIAEACANILLLNERATDIISFNIIESIGRGQKFYTLVPVQASEITFKSPEGDMFHAIDKELIINYVQKMVNNGEIQIV